MPRLVSYCVGVWSYECQKCLSHSAYSFNWPLNAAKPGENMAPNLANDDGRKLFVLDTNVLLHDPTSLFRF